MSPSPSKPRPLSDLAEYVQTHNLAEFSCAYGTAFLVRSSADTDLVPAKRLTGDDWLKQGRDPLATLESSSRRKGKLEASKLHVLVYSLLTPERPDSATIGRSPQADVCINDVSMSKIHARFERVDDASVAVVDLDSMNGTWIGNRELPAKQSCAIEFGTTLSFGQIRLTLLSAEQLCELVKALA